DIAPPPVSHLWLLPPLRKAPWLTENCVLPFTPVLEPRAALSLEPNPADTESRVLGAAAGIPKPCRSLRRAAACRTRAAASPPRSRQTPFCEGAATVPKCWPAGNA